MTQQLIAMEDWWGAEIEGSGSIAVSVKKQCLILDIPETTGLSGDMCAPTIIIKNFPTQEVPYLIEGHFVKFKVDVLIVNEDYVENMIPFDRPAPPDRLRLRINGKDISQSQVMTTPSIQPPLQEYNGLIQEEDFTKDPVPVLWRMIKVVKKSIDQLKEARKYIWQMPEGIKIQQEGESVVYSYVAALKQNKNRADYCKGACFMAGSTETFKILFEQFRNALECFSPEAKTVGFRSLERFSTIWMIEKDLHFHGTNYSEGVRKAVAEQNYEEAGPVARNWAIEINGYTFNGRGQRILFVKLSRLNEYLKPEDSEDYYYGLEFYTERLDDWTAT